MNGVDDGTRTLVNQCEHFPPLTSLIGETDRDHKTIDPGRLEIGVDDGTRTHDDRDHNPGLYQLSYAHHGIQIVTRLAPLLHCHD